jgi:iron complex transport system ATP-binding protein
MVSALLEGEGIELRIGTVTILQDCHLRAEPAQLLAVVGPNGAGKTTLLRVLGGLLRPQRGTVALDGRRLRSLSRFQVARTISLVPQDTHVGIHWTVGEFVAMGRFPHLGRFRPATDADRDAVTEAMQQTEIAHLAERALPTLSAGERQRAFLARALATQAPIILLDEPTANLDVQHALQFFELLGRQTAAGRTCVMALHDLNAALRFADQAAVMDAGHVVIQAPPAEALDDERLQSVFAVKAHRHKTPAGRPQLTCYLQAPDAQP